MRELNVGDSFNLRDEDGMLLESVTVDEILEVDELTEEYLVRVGERQFYVKDDEGEWVSDEEIDESEDVDEDEELDDKNFDIHGE